MAELINTADANAVPSDIRNGDTLYVKGEKITGTQGFSVSNTTLVCPTDWYVDGTTIVIPESWLRNR